jgi:cytoskeletal protein RodZ
MSSTPFGEHLRREREMRGVSLDEISAATRISTRFLEALEREQWEHLPGGAFNRGFIRSVARFLGIDEDALVAEYAFERQDVDAARAPAAQSAQIPRDWRPVAISVIVVVLLVASSLFAYHRYGGRIAARVRARLAHGTVTSMVASASHPSTAANSPLTKESAGLAQPAAAASPLALTIHANKPVELTVVTDGKTAFAGRLQANDVREFQAQNTFDVSSSNAAALALSLNGRALPPAGAGDHPSKVTLTRNDLPSAAEASH